jgi:hypothetical protein
MADGEGQGSDLVKAVGQAVGLLAGAVGLVYLVGGAVFTLRLFIGDLPSLTIVPQLSRELLVSVGLAQVVLARSRDRSALRCDSNPLRRDASSEAPRGSVGSAFARGWIELGAASAVPALAITVFGVYQVPQVQREWDLAWLVPAGMLLSMLIVLVALRLRASLAVAYRDRWNERRPLLLMALVVWLAVVPACLVFCGNVPAAARQGLHHERL